MPPEAWKAFLWVFRAQVVRAAQARQPMAMAAMMPRMAPAVRFWDGGVVGERAVRWWIVVVRVRFEGLVVVVLVLVWMRRKGMVRLVVMLVMLPIVMLAQWTVEVMFREPEEKLPRGIFARCMLLLSLALLVSRRW